MSGKPEQVNDTHVRPAGGRGRFRLLAMVVLPLALLALGVAGYRQLAQPPERAGLASSRSKAWARHGPRGPRYGRSGAWQRPRQNRPPLVRVQQVHLRPWRQELVFYGRVVARQRPELRMAVSGRIAWVSPRLRAGERVRKGEELIRLDETRYRLALNQARASLKEIRARVAEARAQLEQHVAALENARRQLQIARRELERQRRLAQRGVASPKAVDEAALAEAQKRLTVVEKQSAVRMARARLAQYQAQEEHQQQAVKEAEQDLQDTILRAPFDALVLSAAASAGQYVTSADRLATLVALDDIQVRFTMSQERHGDLLAAGGRVKGLAVRIVWQAGQARRVLKGRIERLAGEVDEDSGAVAAFASLDDGAADLRIGTLVDVIVQGPVLPAVALLPEGALHDGRVFVVRDGTLQPRQVRALAWHDGTVVVSGGLKEGETVLASHLPQARAGMRVRVGRP